MVAKKIIVTGITQGVGFRPYIYRLAKKYDLRGHVANLGGSEVEIVVEGDERNIEKFIRSMSIEKPPPARIDAIEIDNIAPQGYSDFKILPSKKNPQKFSQIPPDFSICDHCLREILDPRSRFYGYVFNSCAWCGPRFSIMFDIPYDRENTAMRDFPLCSECMSEYSDPENIRRFHAQGISCPRCGPKIWIIDKYGEALDVDDPITYAAKLIDEGNILAIKGIGGFHIATLATDDDVIITLRKRKNRSQKPFAIMALNINVAKGIVYVDDSAEKVLLSPQRPIVLLKQKEEAHLSKYVAPGLDKQGVMIAYSGIHYLLLSATRDKFLIMTSGNRKNKPICRTIEEARKQIGEFVDYFLVHNRKIINRVDDSVVRFTDNNVMFLRRSRGFAPEWIVLPVSSRRPIVALGAELQNTGAIGFDNKAILTQHIGDMDEIENVDFLESALAFLIKAYRLDVGKGIIVADKHPAYVTRRLAEEWSARNGARIMIVQHHIAHIMSVLAEHGIDPSKKIVGIAIDGIGYGDDGQIWGGEVFFGRPEKLRRVGHLIYSPMPGGDKATRFPIRMLIGILSMFLGDDEIRQIINKRGLIRGLRNEKELDVILKQARYPRTIKTSSMGRTLDSVSAFLGICLERTYEGEPAIKLEAFAREGKILDDIDIKIEYVDGQWIINTKKMFESILEIDADAKSIARTVQYKLGYAMGEIAKKYLSLADIQTIFVSGGAAVNDYIIKGIHEGSGADILLNRKVPAGDGGISLGQIYYAIISGGAE